MSSIQELPHKGKVALVTGAGSGIGRATALAFARNGAKVALWDLSDLDNAETARLIEEAGGSALPTNCDVSQSEQIEVSLKKVIESFGR